MEKHFLWITLCTALAFAVSCDKPDSGKADEHEPGLPEEATEISFGALSSDSDLFKATASSGTITLKSSDTWTISCDGNADWLTITPSSGEKGNVSISVSTKENSTGASRTAKLCARCGDKTAELEIMQRADPYTKSLYRTGKISNKVLLTYSEGTKLARIYTILPLPQSNAYQDISAVNIFGASRITCRDKINAYIYKDIVSSFPQSGQPVIEEEFEVKSYNVSVDFDKITDIAPYDKTSSLYSTYTKREPDDLVDPKNPEVKNVANTLWDETNGNIIDYSRKCYEWTASNMTYGNMNTGLHPITELMNTKVGDCGNFASVFISLLRAKGIPARHLVMIDPWHKEYHVRAEFYVPAYGWVPADPTFKNGNPLGDYFGKFTDSYVVVSQGVGLSIQGPEGNTTIGLLQSFAYWYWYIVLGPVFEFNHSFSLL